MNDSKQRPAGTTTDDRGERREVVSAARLFEDARMNDPAFAAVVERVLRLKTSGMKLWKTVAIAVAAAIVFTAVALLLRFSVGVRLPVWMGGAVPGLAISFLSLWYLRRFEKQGAPEIARILLADGLCACCGYTLADIPEDADGCVVCPECGGAWRGDRVVRAVRYRENLKDRPRVRGFLIVWRDGIGMGATGVTDDAGVDRPLVSGRLRREIASAEGERLNRMKDAVRENLRCGRVVRWGIGGFYLVLGVAVPVGVAMVVRNPWVTLGAAGAGVLLVGFGMCLMRGCAGITAKWVRRSMLRRGMCPSCSSDLENVDRADGAKSGMWDCGECGASWRVTDVMGRR